MDLREELLAIVAALDRATIDYALCGGLAVAVHGFVRTTRDIDLLVRREDVPAILQVLAPLGYTVPGGEIPFAVGTPEELRIERVSKTVGEQLLSIDLLQVYPVLADVWESVEVFAWAGREITVVSATGLAKMKRLSGRPKDLLDLRELGIDDATA